MEQVTLLISPIQFVTLNSVRVSHFEELLFYTFIKGKTTANKLFRITNNATVAAII